MNEEFKTAVIKFIIKPRTIYEICAVTDRSYHVAFHNLKILEAQGKISSFKTDYGKRMFCLPKGKNNGSTTNSI